MEQIGRSAESSGTGGSLPGWGRWRGPGFLVLLAVGVGLAACGGDSEGLPAEEVSLVAGARLGEPAEPIPDPAEEAPALVAGLEALLLEDTGVILPFTVEAEGALEVALEGSMQLASGGRARLEAEGSFGGEPVTALLISDGVRMVWVDNGERHEAPAPSHLREGLVLGLSRMGVLHNLARLVSGSPPDATDGTAGEWVQITGPAHAGSDPSEPTGVAVHFGIVVGGVPAGEATLWMDPQTGVPLLRRQEVSFPGGSMHVTERYSAPMADVEVGDSLFVIPGAMPAATRPAPVSGVLPPRQGPAPATSLLRLH